MTDSFVHVLFIVSICAAFAFSTDYTAQYKEYKSSSTCSSDTLTVWIHGRRQRKLLKVYLMGGGGGATQMIWFWKKRESGPQ